MLFGILAPYSYGLDFNIGLTAWLGIACIILEVVGLWKMFEKANVAGWKALIPVYNLYLLYKISWQTKMFWFGLGTELFAGIFCYLAVGTFNSAFLYFAYGLSIVAAIIQACLCYNVSLAYGHGIGYFLGIYLLDFLFYPIIGFGSSRYIGNRYEGYTSGSRS